MPRRLLLAALIVGLVLPALTPAAEADTRVTNIEIQTPAGVTVGDHFDIVISLSSDAGSSDYELAAGTLPGYVTLIETPDPVITDLGDGTQEVRLDIVVAAFVTGDVPLPALTVTYLDPQGNPGEVETPAASFLVASVLGGSPDLTPRDLHPQAEIGTPNALGLILVALAVVIAALLLVLTVLYLSTRRKPAVARSQAVAVEQGPEDRARADLDRAAVDFAADNNLLPYYTTIAVTVRNYLTERYGFPAFALTTSELRDEMLRRGIDRWQVRLADGLLSQCDAAVYAGYEPAPERADTDLTTAYELVEMSRPEPVEEEQEAAPVS